MKKGIKTILILAAILGTCLVWMIQSAGEDQTKSSPPNKIGQMANKIANSIRIHKESGKIVVLLEKSNIESMNPVFNDFYNTISNVLANRSGGFKVIEKSIMEKLLGELNYGSSNILDSAAYIKLGKIAGADVLVTGSVSIYENNVYYTLQAIDINSSKILTSTHTSLPLKNLQLYGPMDDRKNKDKNDPNYIFDKGMDFFTQNWSWLWTVIFVPIGGWVLTCWKKKSKRKIHSQTT